MNKQLFVSIFGYSGIGITLGYMDIRITSWQFWVIILCTLAIDKYGKLGEANSVER